MKRSLSTGVPHTYKNVVPPVRIEAGVNLQLSKPASRQSCPKSLRPWAGEKQNSASFGCLSHKCH